MLRKSDSLIFMAKHRLRAFLVDEGGDVNIVLLVVLTGVALLLVFRR